MKSNSGLSSQYKSAIAIVGSGYWGRNHVRNFYQLGALSLVCDENPDALEFNVSARGPWPRKHNNAHKAPLAIMLPISQRVCPGSNAVDNCGRRRKNETRSYLNRPRRHSVRLKNIPVCAGRISTHGDGARNPYAVLIFV